MVDVVPKAGNQRKEDLKVVHVSAEIGSLVAVVEHEADTHGMGEVVVRNTVILLAQLLAKFKRVLKLQSRRVREFLKESSADSAQIHYSIVL